ncbi:hypothetical protein AVEN_208021-1 [Araneus ventricosus]|uniref:Integrase catalytic domain-containing protein n=1 Tax=Araneus ventricosus TaxID=182803 RepID=A0A4Y2F414_ARAVE|nr:hypothetical protein AVEN_208021-1 [Araneus ventricosus]
MGNHIGYHLEPGRKLQVLENWFQQMYVDLFNYSFQKKCFLVVFKGTYTKFHYSFVIKEKSEVKDVLKIMLAHAKNLGHSLKEFLSDNRCEFDKKEVCAILSQEGIAQRLTAPYMPEQNGGSECEMLTIIEMAKTFKYSNPDINYLAAMGLNWLPQLYMF